MARILHCGTRRKAKAFWLDSKNMHYDYEVLLEAFCSQCKKMVLEVFGFSFEKGTGPVERISKKHYNQWEQRKLVDLRFVHEPEQKPLRDTRALVFVSEYTLRISRNTTNMR